MYGLLATDRASTFIYILQNNRYVMVFLKDGVEKQMQLCSFLLDTLHCHVIWHKLLSL